MRVYVQHKSKSEVKRNKFNFYHSTCYSVHVNFNTGLQSVDEAQNDLIVRITIQNEMLTSRHNIIVIATTLCLEESRPCPK